MKIAMTDPAFFTWPYDSALIEGLINNGHEVHFFSMKMPDSAKKDTRAHLHEIFYPGLDKPILAKLPRPAFLLAKGLLHFISYFRLIAQLKRLKPDAIHVQWAPLPVVDLLFLPTLRKIAPLVFTVHDSSPFNNNPSAKLQRLGAFRIMRAFDRLIVHTEKARQDIMARGVPAAHITRIAHGVIGGDPKISAPPPSRDLHKQMEILLFGKLKHYKGADLLIQALAQLSPEERQKCRLRVVGKAEMDTQPLFELAETLGVAAAVTWDLRFVSDAEMADIFAAADVMAMPYRQIDASGVLMVALGMGRPILASRIGLFSELLEHGTHGLLVTPENVDELAQAIRELLNNPDQRLKMAENVKALGAAIPSWDEIGQQTTQLYQTARA